jgi:uncharacterized protein YigA (DUF484 family)
MMFLSINLLFASSVPFYFFSEKERLNELLDVTDQAAKTYSVDKHELELKKHKLAAYEDGAKDLMNFMFKTVSL